MIFRFTQPMQPILRSALVALLALAADPEAIATEAVVATPAVEAVTAATAMPAGTPAVTAPRPKPVRNPAFYTTEVSIVSQNAGEKRGASMRALAQVIVRLTGNPQAPSNPVIRRGMGGIETLTRASKVRQDSELVNGVPVYRTILALAFDPEGVDALIAGAGLRFWTSERPKPILWLAIDDGRGPRLVTGQQTNVVKPLATRGLERGMRYLLPAGTAAEKSALPAIVRLDAAALQPLTARYGNNAQLVGKVYRQAPGWAADWVLSDRGAEVARWSFADTDPRRVIASGVDEGANALAKRDGVYLDTGVAGLYLVDIGGINGSADYVRAMATLQSIPVVRHVIAVEASPTQLRLQLDLSVGMKGFRTLMGSDGALRAAATADGGIARFDLQ